jgi:putative membrane protein
LGKNSGGENEQRGQGREKSFHARKIAWNAAAKPQKIVPCFPAQAGALCNGANFRARIMEPGTKRLLQFLKSWIINTLAVLLAVQIVHGIHFRDDGLLPPVLTALTMGILNAFIRPVLVILALPLLIFTLGLFMLIINALLLYFVGMLLTPYFQVDTFGAAFLGALVISVISIALNLLTGGARVKIQRHKPPPKNPGNDDGPVIDV